VDLFYLETMLPDIMTASFVVFYLATFFAINLYNVMKFHLGGDKEEVHAEIRRPEGLTTSLSVFGTLMFFLESVLFSSLIFTGFNSALRFFPLQLQFQHDSYVQIAGITLMGAGCFIFIWSVIARGRYAVSWEMPENHKLVTWGPYSYVRHPSYLGYFLMFCGLFLIWLNLIALVPLVAIPGYVWIAAKEEELLIHRFGEDYIRYHKNTGRFLPKLSRRE